MIHAINEHLNLFKNYKLWVSTGEMLFSEILYNKDGCISGTL